MNFVIDILILVLLAFLAIFGIKKGFIKSAFELLGAFIAVSLAAHFRVMIAEAIYNSFLRHMS